VAERTRIARDLHDILGHTLSVIVLKTELAGRFLRRQPEADLAGAVREIGEVEQTARASLAEVRHAIRGYRAPGLLAEIASVRNTLSAADVSVQTDIPARVEGLTATQETMLSLALREAVTNVIRHAHASRCHIEMTLSDDGLCILRIADDSSRKIPCEGNGIRGMRERVQSLDGRLSIEYNQGNVVRFEFPVTPAERGVRAKLSQPEVLQPGTQ